MHWWPSGNLQGLCSAASLQGAGKLQQREAKWTKKSALEGAGNVMKFPCLFKSRLGCIYTNRNTSYILYIFVFAYFWDIFQCIYIYLHTHGNISNIIYMKQVEIMVSFTSVSPSCCNNRAGYVMIWLHGRSFDNTQRAPGWLIFKDRYSFPKEKGFVILLILLTIIGGFWNSPMTLGIPVLQQDAQHSLMWPF